MVREYRLNLKFNTDTCISLKVILLSVILELSVSVGRRTQSISKLLNDLLITSALNPFSELLPNLYFQNLDDKCKLIWILNNEDPTILRYLCQYLLSTTI